MVMGIFIYAALFRGLHTYCISDCTYLSYTTIPVQFIYTATQNDKTFIFSYGINCFKEIANSVNYAKP